MEAELPEGALILSVDEHTAVLLDLADRTAAVVGNGRLTVRRRGRSTGYPSGSVVDLAALTGDPAAAPAVSAGSATSAEPATSARGIEGYGEARPISLRAATDRAVSRFDAALAARDIDGCVAAVLELEQARDDWSTDTLTSDEGDYARAALRGMVVRLRWTCAAAPGTSATPRAGRPGWLR